MKPISEWSIFIRLASIVTVVGTVTTVWSYKDAIADAVPFPTKVAMIEAIDGIKVAFNNQIVVNNTLLDKVLWNQLQLQFRSLETNISDLRTQKIQMKDMIERETDPVESIQKQVRLDAISHDLTSKESEYDCISKQIENRDVNSAC